jgi:hypothetical protein
MQNKTSNQFNLVKFIKTFFLKKRKKKHSFFATNFLKNKDSIYSCPIHSDFASLNPPVLS